MSEEDIRSVKCVFLGDEAVGKTSLIVAYTKHGYPTHYVPTTFDNYSVVVQVDEKPIRVQLCDTAGQRQFDKLRPFSYPQCDVFVIVYSVIDQRSFASVTRKWTQEIAKVAPNTPVILVGTQLDCRWKHHEVVSSIKGRALANQIGAVEFYECSALTTENLKQMFDAAIVAGLQRGSRRVTSSDKKASRMKQRFQRFIDITRKLI